MKPHSQILVLGLLAEESVLEAGLPNIPMSWVHIPFAERMRFSEGGMARMVSPEQLPFNFSSTPALEMEVGIERLGLLL